jgi:phosphoglucosamine mutase
VTSRKYFGTDGIRDRAGRGLLAPERVRAYGRALGRYVATRKAGGRVLIGRDTRASGPAISSQLCEGLTAHGLSAVDAGTATTPAIQALCREEDFDLGVVVSASHNPAEDNGIKVFGGDGRKLGDAEEAEVERLVDEDRGPQAPASGGRLTADPGAESRYVKFVRETCLPRLDLANFAVVLDCAHGAASHVGPRLLDAFGARISVFHAEPDGTNINREAGVFFAERLREYVLDRAPAVGVALDGDADRALFIDEGGALRDGDDVLGVLAADLKRRGLLAGARVVTTVMSNFGLTVHLRRHGIAQETTGVGDRYVAARMAETGAILGGEPSGHLILRDGNRWHGDGLLTALRVFDVMRRAEKTLAELCAGIEKFPQVLLNVPVASKPPVEDVPGLAAAIRSAEAALGGEGRVLLRYSGTESILRVMVEGREEAKVRRLAEELADVARRASA